jgi:FkbH-like protein
VQAFINIQPIFEKKALSMDKKQSLIEFFNQFFNNNLSSMLSGNELFKLIRRFKKIEPDYNQQHKTDLQTKKIAILGSFSTQFLTDTMKLYLYNMGISPIFYEAEYDSIASDILDQDSNLYQFQPDILIILTHHKDIKTFPSMFCDDKEIDHWDQSYLSYYDNLWKTASQLSCQILQSNFVIPVHRSIGNQELMYPFSVSASLMRLNHKLLMHKPSNVTFIDMDYLASCFGKWEWFDDVNYFMSKQGFSFEALGLVSHYIARLISTIFGKIKKCLVLDLDNTLWGGVIGDDGLDGIILDPNNAVGEAYLFFQNYVKQLKDRGVILAVCSKNETDIAQSVFKKHPEMKLKLDDIACFIANWNDKASNLKLIAKQLNIGLDSLVFFDDNPAEREIVKRFLPDVEVIDVPDDPALYVKALLNSKAFEWHQLSKEDLFRTDYYIANKQRIVLEQTLDYDSYLNSLEMKGTIDIVSKMELPRVAQLIAKSNQFNLRTKRYSEARLMDMMTHNKYLLIYVRLSDKFGDYGVISCIILKKMNDQAFIDTWIMSCRVLKRSIENAVLNYICLNALKWGCTCVIGEYLPTPKNALVKNHYQNLGFNKISNDTEQGDRYILELSENMQMKKHFISIGE